MRLGLDILQFFDLSSEDQDRAERWIAHSFPYNWNRWCVCVELLNETGTRVRVYHRSPLNVDIRSASEARQEMALKPASDFMAQDFSSPEPFPTNLIRPLPPTLCDTGESYADDYITYSKITDP